MLSTRLKADDRCPNAEYVGVRRVVGYRLDFTRKSKDGHGVADIVRAKRNVVWGVLWRLNDREAKILDKREGVAIGSYENVPIKVETNAQSTTCMNARTYIVPAKSRTGAGLPTNRKYAGYILQGAREHRLPRRYVAKLTALWEASKE